MSGKQPNQGDLLGLADAYAVVTPADNKNLYARWATSYDISFVEANRYRYPRAIAEHFDEVTPLNIGDNFVDVGCGTGIVGARLASLRPACRISGIDISPEMLAQAGKKFRSDSSPVYQNLIEADLTRPIDARVTDYDAMLSAGTFTHGHLGPEAIRNLLPIVRAGGWFVIGVNAEHFGARGFADMLASIRHLGHIDSLSLDKIQVYEEGSPHFGDQAVIATFRRVN